MKVVALLLIVEIGAFGDSSSVLDDLQRRLIVQYDSFQSAPGSRDARTTSKIGKEAEAWLELDQPQGAGMPSVEAALSLPEHLVSPAPAVLVVRVHHDILDQDTGSLSAVLARQGFIVLALDLVRLHDDTNVLAQGRVPQTYLQHVVRSAIRYLSARRDVDSRRIGLVGSGLAATLAVALNQLVSSAVLIDAVPDIKEQLEELRMSDRGGLPESCLLIPGFLRFARTQELLALIVPRSILIVNPPQTVLDYATQLYGTGGRLQYLSRELSSADIEEVVGEFFRRSFREPIPGLPVEKVVVKVSPVAISLGPTETQTRGNLTPIIWEDRLGGPLANRKMSMALQVKRRQDISLATQIDLRVPITVLRPSIGEGVEKGVLVAVDDSGREILAEDEVVQAALVHGWMVFCVDPRGIGSLKQDLHVFVFVASLLLGENFVWRQAYDIKRTIDWLVDVLPNYRTALYARGPNAALIAAYVGIQSKQQGDTRNDPEWMVVREQWASFASVPKGSFEILPTNWAGEFDISDLLDQSKPRPMSIKDLKEMPESNW